MSVVLVIGAILLAAGAAILFNILGAASFVTRTVTSRSLGQLAPGYAATAPGLRTYAVLLISIGLVCAALGLGVAGLSGKAVALLLGLGGATFVVASVVAVVGEVRTYRRL